jgi:adenylate kinase family enzyme
MTKKIFNRILIVGDACRGKSTLASKLSTKFGIPHHSTDDFLYEIKFTKYRDKQEAVDLISKIFKNEKWIVEGTTKMLYKFGLESSDIIINLRYRSILIQWLYLTKRYLSRDEETLRGLYKLMKHVLFKKYHLGYRKDKPTPTEIIEPYKHKVVTLSSFREIDNFLNSL